MTDRDSVMKQLEECLSASCRGFRACPYDKEWDAVKAAYDLLKEQEPVKPVEKWDHGFYYACGSCWEELGIVREYPSYCPCCGKKVKWDG